MKTLELDGEATAQILPLLRELYPDLGEAVLLERLRQLRESKWRCVAVYDGTVMVAMSGYWLETRLYCGKFLYIDHFIVSKSRRARGVGKALMEYLKAKAEAEQCKIICLDTFAGNSRAQKFWFREGFAIVGFHFAMPVGAREAGA